MTDFVLQIRSTAPRFAFSVQRGRFWLAYDRGDRKADAKYDVPPVVFHRPMLAIQLTSPLSHPRTSFHCPVWLVLYAVLGWIVFFEVRWRGKMRATAEKHDQSQ